MKCVNWNNRTYICCLHIQLAGIVRAMDLFVGGVALGVAECTVGVVRAVVDVPLGMVKGAVYSTIEAGGKMSSVGSAAEAMSCWCLQWPARWPEEPKRSSRRRKKLCMVLLMVLKECLTIEKHESWSYCSDKPLTLIMMMHTQLHLLPMRINTACTCYSPYKTPEKWTQICMKNMHLLDSQIKMIDDVSKNCLQLLQEHYKSAPISFQIMSHILSFVLVVSGLSVFSVWILEKKLTFKWE